MSIVEENRFPEVIAEVDRMIREGIIDKQFKAQMATVLVKRFLKVNPHRRVMIPRPLLAKVHQIQDQGDWSPFDG